jgi:hypothetical protein
LPKRLESTTEPDFALPRAVLDPSRTRQIAVSAQKAERSIEAIFLGPSLSLSVRIALLIRSTANA